MTDENGNYQETNQSLYGLRTFAQADSLRELTQRGLTERKQDGDYILRVNERADGLFDMIVLKRTN